MYSLYSVIVVAPMIRSSPRASADLNIFAASDRRSHRRTGTDDGVSFVDEENDVVSFP